MINHLQPQPTYLLDQRVLRAPQRPAPQQGLAQRLGPRALRKGDGHGLSSWIVMWTHERK
jgi:hypothetical protein